MGLIYLSPVPWSSFAQRPHKFVEWFHTRTGKKVLWIDPYPTRFPSISDFRRFGSKKNSEQKIELPWLQVIRPSAIPIEPLPGSGYVNRFLWNNVFQKLDLFSSEEASLVVVGKPSVLACLITRRMENCFSVYDAMDDFPAFYAGLSRLAMSRRENTLVRSVKKVLVSSTGLKHRWGKVCKNLTLVHNGLDSSVLPLQKNERPTTVQKVFGYIGTIAAWFDWEWVIALAQARPKDIVRIIGPVFSTVPARLPDNIEMLPACDHADALSAMQGFDIGLIPFKNNELTASVDPIKYYEYRALGLPVVSTAFGEMAFREDELGIFISHNRQDISSLITKALSFEFDIDFTRKFAALNSWEARFDSANIL